VFLGTNSYLQSDWYTSYTTRTVSFGHLFFKLVSKTTQKENGNRETD